MSSSKLLGKNIAGVESPIFLPTEYGYYLKTGLDCKPGILPGTFFVLGMIVQPARCGRHVGEIENLHECGGQNFQTLKKGLDFHPNPLILFWRRLPDLNRGITALQAVALPLG